ncbi:restriction endonuclease [Shewanella xiamenensis]|uniref:Restriction endonuclease n=1 Tax=Shewanella xiamenensis TaxID=332186 RepID=A0AAW6QTZ4_9GAMM|nr:AAA family ATPase [Shewanella xiamenensis]MDG5899369.1 restriction endonuclease [Shewanella xiamenensis]
MLDIQNEIRTWLHSQQDWLQELAEKLLQNGNLTQDDLTIASQKIKSFDGQKVTNNRNFVGLSEVKSYEGELRLRSIGNIQGIENLSPRTPMMFGSRNFNVVYGHNGSGKSSYTRILKKASGKPRAVLLKSNVYNVAPKSQQCDIEYEIGGELHKVEWHANSESIAALNAIDVFDSEESSHYLRSESSATYIPPIVSMFERLAVACDQVKQLLQSEQDKLVSCLPQLPVTYMNTDVAKKLGSLTYLTSEAVLEQQLTWTEEDQIQLAFLNKRLEETDPLASAKQLRTTKEQVQKIVNQLRFGANAYGAANLANLKLLQSNALTKRRIATEAAYVSSAKLDLVGSKAWRALWEAAREYSQMAYPNSSFPVTTDNSRCVLCHQELDHDAKQRLKDFESFVQGKLEGEAKLAEQAYSQSLANLPAIPTFEQLATQSEAARLLTDDWRDYFRNFWTSAQNTKNSLLSNVDISSIVPVPDSSEAENVLLDYANMLENQAKQLDQDALEFNRVQATQVKLNYEAKLWISQQANAVKAEVQRLKEIAKYEAWKSSVNSRSISSKSSTISEKVITQHYVKRFNLELKSLGAERIRVELVKTKVTKGKILHRLQLKKSTQSHPLELVLSEGERRIISLAAFLADVADKPMNAPFIFDDPISSLDHDFEWHVANRLAELAKTRQVIIFTHRLSLYGAVEDAARKLGDKFKEEHLQQVCIESFDGLAGHPVDEKTWNANTTKATNILLDRLTIAKQAGNVSGSDSYRYLAQGICSDFRKLLERTVEDDLLNAVVKRHRRSVTTDNRLNTLVLIEREDCELIDKLMSKYSFYEHSQSFETPSFIPEASELLEDIEALKNWRVKFKARQKAA